MTEPKQTAEQRADLLELWLECSGENLNEHIFNFARRLTAASQRRAEEAERRVVRIPHCVAVDPIEPARELFFRNGTSAYVWVCNGCLRVWPTRSGAQLCCAAQRLTEPESEKPTTCRADGKPCNCDKGGS